jgi:hypothetical protein
MSILAVSGDFRGSPLVGDHTLYMKSRHGRRTGTRLPLSQSVFLSFGSRNAAANNIPGRYLIFIIPVVFNSERPRFCTASKEVLHRHRVSPMTTMDLVIQTVTGAFFGAALTASGVWNPSTIVEQMRLQNFHMLKVFMTASSASA